MEAEIRQETKLRREAKLRRPKVNTTEEGKGSGMGALDGEEVQDKDDKEDRGEVMMTSVEEIDGTDKNAERDDNVSDGCEDVDWYTVRDSGGSEAEKWESDRSDGAEN